MSLYERLINDGFIDSCIYYTNYGKPVDINRLLPNNCYRFIKRFFEAGAKERLFEISFSNEYEEQGKHVHTLVLYLLGCYFKEIINSMLLNIIDETTKTDNSWYDFRHTWFLSCFYHDVASVIESAPILDLPTLLNKYGIKNHVLKNKSKYSMTYRPEIIESYYEYVRNEINKVEHGILAGFLLYDRLMKGYHDARRRTRTPMGEPFTERNVLWRKEHLDLYVIIADSIMAHNIWSIVFTNKYPDLKPLDISARKRISMNVNPLSHFLCLFDTIEPTKRPKLGNDPIEILRSVDITYSNNKLTITLLDSVRNNACYKEWLEDVKKMEEWLELKAELKDRNTKLEISWDALH